MKKLVALVLTVGLFASPALAGFGDANVNTTANFIKKVQCIPSPTNTGAVTAAWTMVNHEDWIVLNVDMVVRAKTLTVGTVDLLDDGVSILTTKPDINAAAAGANAAGVIDSTKKTIVAGSLITVNYALTGTSWTDGTMCFTYRTKAATE